MSIGVYFARFLTTAFEVLSFRAFAGRSWLYQPFSAPAVGCTVAGLARLYLPFARDVGVIQQAIDSCLNPLNRALRVILV